MNIVYGIFWYIIFIRIRRDDGAADAHGVIGVPICFSSPPDICFKDIPDFLLKTIPDEGYNSGEKRRNRCFSVLKAMKALLM